MFEIGKRYAEYGSDWKQFEIISRKGNSITYVKIQHTGQYNEKSGEPKNINKSEFKEIWILENKEPKKVRVKILESDGKFTSVESRDLKIDDEIIVSQRSGNE